MSVQRIDHIILGSGPSGEISRGDYEEFLREMEAIGVTEVHWLRQGSMTVQAMRAVA